MHLKRLYTQLQRCGGFVGSFEMKRSLKPEAFAHSAGYHRFSEEEIRLMRENLVQWYRCHRRRLAWRGDDPPFEPLNGKEVRPADWFNNLEDSQRGYRVWVSEIMLQQTRVETVIDYYQKWMKKLPTLDDLAAADPAVLNEIWAGLGYYSRVRRLQEAALKVRDELNGVFPRTAQDLLKLPGIGPYTAGAISSIAFQQRSPLVDGNVIRVFSRLRGILAPPNQPSAVKLHWEIADELVPSDCPGDFNQALMELGARVCTPKSPRCGECPVKDLCIAQKEIESERRPFMKMDEEGVCELCCDEDIEDIKSVERYPMKKIRKAQRIQVSYELAAESKDGKFLLTRRPEKGVLCNQWTFPSSEEDLDVDDDLDSHSCIPNLRSNVLQNIAAVSEKEFKGESFSRVGSFVHVFSHIRRTIVLEKTKLPFGSNGDSEKHRWVSLEDLQHLSLTTSVKKCIKLLMDDLKPGKRQKTIGHFFKQ